MCIPGRAVMFPAISSINNNLNSFNRFLKSLMRCDCCHAIALITNFRYRCDVFDSRIIQLRRGFPLRLFNAALLKRTNSSMGSQTHTKAAYAGRCDGVSDSPQSFSIVRQMILITTYINTQYDLWTVKCIIC